MSHDHGSDHSPQQPLGHPQREPDRLDRFVRHWAVTVLMVGIVVFYLVAEHRAHFFGALPWLILLACPLLHIFMHGGHGAHGGHDSSPDEDREGDR